MKETTWGSDGIRNVLREHAVADGTKPVKQIELAVKELNVKRAQEPKMYPDSIYQKELSKLKGGYMPDGSKIQTLTIIIKPTDNSSYKNMVDALDEMQILSIGTYVIDKINPDDEKMLTERVSCCNTKQEEYVKDRSLRSEMDRIGIRREEQELWSLQAS